MRWPLNAARLTQKGCYAHENAGGLGGLHLFDETSPNASVLSGGSMSGSEPYMFGNPPVFCQQWAGDCFHAMLAGVYRRDVAFRLVSDRKAVAQLFTTVASHFRELYNLHVTVSTDA